jgi:hypothetical protein
MVAERVGVAVCGALLVVAVHLSDGGLQVDRHQPITGSGTSPPRPGQHLLGQAVELADMPEGEGAQQGPQGGGRHDPMAEHLAGGAAAQQVGVVDTAPTRDHGVDQGQQLAPRMGGASPLAQVDQRIGGLLDASRWASVAGSSPALAIAWVSSKRVSSWSRVWEDVIENVPS